MKLFLDANVLFSAAHREEGRAQDLVALARAGHCELQSSAHALEEARRNLALKSRGFERRLSSALEHIAIVAEAPAHVVAWAREQGLPLKDAPILAAAVHAKADLLVTGDRRDIGHLFGQAPHGAVVVTPAVALDKVLKSAGQRAPD
ncbi:MAG: PIN domain-containing protein [Betaproteobacteria bacterium]|nr:PIN domain-containing protein [Betaproteobacteria bacterium]